jgi:hypothetical protein
VSEGRASSELYALDFHTKALPIYLALGANHAYVAYPYNGLGEVYSALGNFAKGS